MSSQITKAIGYVRDRGNKNALNKQIQILTDFGCDPIFVEDDARVRKFRYLVFQSAIKIVSRVDFILVVPKLNVIPITLNEIRKLLKTLRSHGAHFVSLAEGIDTRHQNVWLILNSVLAVKTEHEFNIARGTRLGLAAARLQGRVGGRPVALSETKIAEARQLILRSDLSMGHIARRLGVSRSSLYNAGLSRTNQSTPKNKGRP
jgi:DNA invertase Pin-like site-specific DNA recombinase